MRLLEAHPVVPNRVWLHIPTVVLDINVSSQLPIKKPMKREKETKIDRSNNIKTHKDKMIGQKLREQKRMGISTVSVVLWRLIKKPVSELCLAHFSL